MKLQEYKISKFVFMLQKRDFLVLWNRIYGGYAILSYEKYNALQNFSSQNTLNNEERGHLLKRNIIVPQKDNEELLLTKKIHTHIESASSAQRLKCLELSVSEHCNYRCSYCTFWKNKDNEKRKFMPFELAQRVVDDFLETTKNQKQTLIYFGTAEPFLNWKVIRQIASFVRDSRSDVVLSLITNGSLVKKGHLKFCKENNIKVGISLDGMPERQRKQRIPAKASIDSYDAVINLLELGKEIDFEISCLSATYSKTGFREDIDYLISLCLQYGIKEFDLDFDTNSLYSVNVYALIEDLLCGYKQAKRNDLIVFGYWLIPYYNIINNGNDLKTFCGNVAGQSVCISSAGNFKLCGYEDNSLGQYESIKKHLDSEHFRKICKSMLPKSNSHCKDCLIEGMCGGHCILFKKGDENWRFACEYYQAITKRLLCEHL